MQQGNLRQYLNDGIVFEEMQVVQMAIDLLTQLENSNRSDDSVLLLTPENIVVKMDEGQIYSFWYRDFPDEASLETEWKLYGPKTKGKNAPAFYSLGIVMYQMLNANHLPFVNESQSFEQRNIELKRRFDEPLPELQLESGELFQFIKQLCDVKAKKESFVVDDMLEVLGKLRKEENQRVKRKASTRKSNKNGALLPETLLHGRFRVQKVIGAGGFGITYLAYDEKMDIKVAIKEYFPKNLVLRQSGETQITMQTYSENALFQKGLQRFINEAKILARFQEHTAVVNVFDYFEENHTAYIVMEYLEGQTLKEHIRKNGVLSIDFGAKMMRILAETLAVVHSQGLIHRDVSPDNIFICDNDRIRLIDFGSVKTIQPEGAKTQTLILTPKYAPLEQFQHIGNVDSRVDIYSLGATMYKAFTGKTPVSSLDRVGHDTLEYPNKLRKEIPEYLSDIIMKCMEIHAKDRCADMYVVCNALSKQSKKLNGMKIAILGLAGILLLSLSLFAINTRKTSVGEYSFYGIHEIEKLIEEYVHFEKDTANQSEEQKNERILKDNEKNKDITTEEKIQNENVTTEDKVQKENVTTEEIIQNQNVITEEKESNSSSNKEPIEEQLIVPDTLIKDVN